MKMGIQGFFIMFYNNFIGQLREIKRNIMLFMIPIFVFLFIYAFFTVNKVEENFIEPLQVGLVLGEENIFTEMLTESFTESNTFNNFIELEIGDYSTIDHRFYEGFYDAMIEVPKGFIESIMYFGDLPIMVNIQYSDPMTTVLLKNIFLGYENFITAVEVGVYTLYDSMEQLGFTRDYLIAYNEKISYDLAVIALSRDDLIVLHEMVDIPSSSSITYFFIAIMVLFLMYLSLFSSIQLIREKEDLCFLRLKLTKLSLLSYLVSKAFAICCFIFMLILGWFLLLSLFSENLIYENHLTFLVYIFIAIVFDVAFSMMITSLIEREEGVILFCTIFIFVQAIIGGSIIPIPMMPKILQSLAIISPNYWMIRALLYVQSGVKIPQAWLIMCLFLIGAFSMLWITCYRYQRIE